MDARGNRSRRYFIARVEWEKREDEDEKEDKAKETTHVILLQSKQLVRVRQEFIIPRTHLLYLLNTQLAARCFDNSGAHSPARYFLYSHSIVAGGLLLISYTTRLTPSTSLTMRLLTRANRS